VNQQGNPLRYAQVAIAQHCIGIALLLLGILAPFTLGATTADERFIIMIGFSPIAVIGGFLVYNVSSD